MDEPVVLVWLGVAIAGAIVALVSIRDGIRDADSMKHEANGRRTLASEYVHQQAAYLVIQCLAIYLGTATRQFAAQRLAHADHLDGRLAHRLRRALHGLDAQER